MANYGGWTPALGLLMFTRLTTRILDRAYLAFGWLSGLLFLFLAFVITYQVVARKLEGPMIPGLIPYTGLILAVAATWSLSYSLRSGAHVRIDLLLPFMGRRTRAVADFAAMGAFAFIASITAWKLWAVVVGHPQSQYFVLWIIIGVGFSMMAFTAFQMMVVMLAEGFLPRFHGWMGGKEIDIERTPVPTVSP